MKIFPAEARFYPKWGKEQTYKCTTAKRRANSDRFSELAMIMIALLELNGVEIKLSDHERKGKE